MQWRYPIISFFIFVAWMHSVYYASVRYLPGHLVTYLLLQIWKNYGLYVIDGKHDDGFSAPTWEEMMAALLFGNEKRRLIKPLEMERKDPRVISDMVYRTGTDYMPLHLKGQIFTYTPSNPKMMQISNPDLDYLEAGWRGNTNFRAGR